MSRNLHFDKYVGVMVWCLEDLQAIMWLWRLLSIAMLLVSVYTNLLTILSKKYSPEYFGGDKPVLRLINMFSPTSVPHFTWKMSSWMPKESGSLNGPWGAYLMRQNLPHNQTHPCHIWNWSEKNCARESANVDFQCAKWEMRKKNTPLPPVVRITQECQKSLAH